MRDFSLWEVLGTLPSLENFTLESHPPYAFHFQHAPENSISQSGGLRYFDCLESLDVTGSSFLIRHLLGFIDSPFLKSIDTSFFEHEPEDLLTPSMMIISSKWSQSLKSSVKHLPIFSGYVNHVGDDRNGGQTVQVTRWQKPVLWHSQC